MDIEYWPTFELSMKAALDRARAHPDELREYYTTLQSWWVWALALREEMDRATTDYSDAARKVA